MGWMNFRARRFALVVVIALVMSHAQGVGIVDLAAGADASLTIDEVTTTRGDERVTGVVQGQPVELHLGYAGLGSGIHDLTIKDAHSGNVILNTSVVGESGSANIGISGDALTDAYQAGSESIDLIVSGQGVTSNRYTIDKITRATFYLTDVPSRVGLGDSVSVSYYGWTHDTIDVTLAVDHPPLTDNLGEDEAIQTVQVTPPAGGSRPHVFSGTLSFTPSEYREFSEDTAIRIQLRESVTPGPDVYWGNADWIRISNDPPVADFSVSPQEPRVNQSISFDASTSSDPDGRIDGYAWDFNEDGTTDATGRTITHTFHTSGDKTVALTVTDDGGASNTLRVRVPIVAPPVASFTVSPSDPVTDRTVSFDASSSVDPDGGIDRYAWDFNGDGRTDAVGQVVNHTYGSSGSFTVALTVTDDDGVSNITTRLLSVDPLVYPVANLGFSPDVPSVNETIRFDAGGSSDPDGPIVRYEWTFGDGTNVTTTVPIAEHAYSRGGTVTATVTVVDEDEATDTARETIRINRPPDIEIIASPDNPRRNQTLTLDASASRDPDGRITAFQWDLGDGTRVIDGPPRLTHQYTAFGDYSVTVTVEDDEGASRTAELEISVKNRPPIASFSFSPFRPKPGRGVQFDASATRDLDGRVAEYRWDFDGDGDIEARGGPKIVHTFSNRGRFDVRLIVVDDAGATNVTTTRVTVGSTLPLVEFVILFVLGLWVLIFFWLSGALPDRITDIGFRGRAERLSDLDITVDAGSREEDPIEENEGDLEERADDSDTPGN